MQTIVDVGSNTVRMNVYDVKDGKLKLLFSKKETVGLASYVRGQYMSAAGIEKVISVLEEFKDVLNNLNIHEMRVFAGLRVQSCLIVKHLEQMSLTHWLAGAGNFRPRGSRAGLPGGSY